jgi:iron complex transport system permease protein
MTLVTVEQINSSRRKHRRRTLWALAGLGAAVTALALFSLVWGRTPYPLGAVMEVLAGREIPGVTFAVRTLRLPRMLAGLLAGLAFGASGFTFQTLLRNSLASPDVIGISSGAGAAAVFCIVVLGLSGTVVSAVAVAAGLVTAALVFVLSGPLGGGRMVLIGIGLGAMMSSVTSYLMVKASQWDVPAALRWLSGSLNGVRMSEVPVLATAVTCLGGALLLGSGRLKALELGDEVAATLGVPVRRTRLLLMFCAVGLTAVATAVTGPIAFVAFLSGPIAERVAGAGRSGVGPAALTGAALVLSADLLGQFAFDTRFPVGVITGLLGAPYLIFLLIQSNRKGGAL